MFAKLATIQILLVLAAPFTAHAASQCNTEKSKPCGMSCIRKEFTCHKPTPTDGTAAVVAGSKGAKVAKGK